jgi:hypothetical protein
VLRVNKKSVTVEYGPLTYTVKYHEIRAHRRAGDAAAEAPTGTGPDPKDT